MKIIGIAIGGSKSAVSFARLENNELTILEKQQIITHPESDKKTIDSIMEILDHSNFDFDMISIIVGGPLDTKKGVILNPPHLPGFVHTEIVKTFKDKYQKEVILLNDADACALAEFKFGNHHSHNMAYITFGTGIGSGLILNDKLYTGNNSMAGEIGHVRLSEDGPVGYQKIGSVEGWCAGGNIYRLANNEKIKNTKELFELAKNNDENALKIVDIVAKRLGESISILLDLFNLDTVVIGGIYPRNLALLEDKVKQYTKENSISYNYEVCQIVPSSLNEKIDEYSSLMGVYASDKFQTFYERYPQLLSLKDEIEKSIDILIEAYHHNGKILVCGNGGSSADSGHIVGELMKGFMNKRPLDAATKEKINHVFNDDRVSNLLQVGIPCIDLTSQGPLITAFNNDVDPDLIFAQQVLAYAKNNPHDVLIGISTSGNSKNVVAAIKVARAIGIKSIALTGQKDSECSQYATICLKAPETETYKIQECHLPIYHYICQEIEKRMEQK